MWKLFIMLKQFTWFFSLLEQWDKEYQQLKDKHSGDEGNPLHSFPAGT